MGRHRMADDSVEARAKRRVARKLGFYVHALVFVLVNLGLFVRHLATDTHWPGPSLWGWGLGLAIHGLVTYVSLQGEGLRERMIREEIERMRREEK